MGHPKGHKRRRLAQLRYSRDCRVRTLEPDSVALALAGAELRHARAGSPTIPLPAQPHHVVCPSAAQHYAGPACVSPLLPSCAQAAGSQDHCESDSTQSVLGTPSLHAHSAGGESPPSGPRPDQNEHAVIRRSHCHKMRRGLPREVAHDLHLAPRCGVGPRGGRLGAVASAAWATASCIAAGSGAGRLRV